MNALDFKVFIRSLRRNKLYSGITIIGLAVALIFVILLTVYVRQEFAIDNFHTNKDRVFHLANEFGYGYSGPIGPMLQDQFPEIECFTRFSSSGNGLAEAKNGDKVCFTYALIDPAFFKMFSFPLVEGCPDDVMQERYSMVVTRSFARKLFGNEFPVGKTITMPGNIPVPITGVMEDIPDNTHFRPFDVAVNIAGLSGYWGWNDGDVLEALGISTFDLYLMGKNGTNLTTCAGSFLKCFKENYPMYQGDDAPKNVFVEPLESVYFSSAKGGNKHNSLGLIWTLGAIGAVILLLAIINYINLTIAQGGMRAKEMSMKKLLGSSRQMLFRQFITESVIICLFAFLIAVGLSLQAEKLFNSLMVADISVASFFTPGIILVGFVVIILVGIIAGAIPAWGITRFDVSEVVKGAFRKKTKGVYSKALICFQYVVAVTLIICTIVLIKQTYFMKHYDVGFRKENIARFSYVLDAGKKEALRNEMMKLAGVKNVAFVCGDPVDGGNNTTFDYEGKQLSFQSLIVDSAFFQMLDLNVVPTGLSNVQGSEYSWWTMRNGKAERMILRQQSVWLSQEAVRQLGLADPPLEFKYQGRMQPVLGIVNDFHIRDLSRKLEPLIITPMQEPETPWFMLVQLQGADQFATFHEIGEIYKKMSEGVPFESGFIDDQIAQWYEHTERVARMIGNLCLLAVLLSGMGILAMATYFIQQRVKEIGIRRVNGATVREILQMLINGFLKWIVIALFFACPLGYYVMNRWLSAFAYRTTMDWWIFVASGAFALFLATLMIWWRSWRVATSNPVEAVKSE